MLKYDWTEETQEVGRLEEELERDAVCHRFYSTCTGRTLPTGLLKGLETSKWEKKEFALCDTLLILCYWLRKKLYYRA